MVAIVEPRRPTRRAHARQCVGSCARDKNPDPGTVRNQQYSVTALTDGGTITERYSYTAYGQPTFFDGSGTAISASAEDNRYTYTGREWDGDLNLYHYRACMYDAVSGRFLGRDPIGFEGSPWLLYACVSGQPAIFLDPSGEIIHAVGCAAACGLWLWCATNDVPPGRIKIAFDIANAICLSVCVPPVPKCLKLVRLPKIRIPRLPRPGVRPAPRPARPRVNPRGLERLPPRSGITYVARSSSVPDVLRDHRDSSRSYLSGIWFRIDLAAISRHEYKHWNCREGKLWPRSLKASARLAQVKAR